MECLLCYRVPTLPCILPAVVFPERLPENPCTAYLPSGQTKHAKVQKRKKTVSTTIGHQASGEIARLCHAACFWLSRRRSEEQDAGRSGQDAPKHHFRHRKRPGVPDDRFGFNVFALVFKTDMHVETVPGIVGLHGARSSAFGFASISAWADTESLSHARWFPCILKYL